MCYLTNIQTNIACWLGLNDRDNETGTNASVFVWVDGSNSTYRQFATALRPQTYPAASTDKNDCVSSDT